MRDALVIARVKPILQAARNLVRLDGLRSGKAWDRGLSGSMRVLEKDAEEDGVPAPPSAGARRLRCPRSFLIERPRVLAISTILLIMPGRWRRPGGGAAKEQMLGSTSLVVFQYDSREPWIADRIVGAPWLRRRRRSGWVTGWA